MDNHDQESLKNGRTADDKIQIEIPSTPPTSTSPEGRPVKTSGLPGENVENRQLRPINPDSTQPIQPERVKTLARVETSTAEAHPSSPAVSRPGIRNTELKHSIFSTTSNPDIQTSHPEIVRPVDSVTESGSISNTKHSAEKDIFEKDAEKDIKTSHPEIVRPVDHVAGSQSAKHSAERDTIKTTHSEIVRPDNPVTESGSNSHENTKHSDSVKTSIPEVVRAFNFGAAAGTHTGSSNLIKMRIPEIPPFNPRGRSGLNTENVERQETNTKPSSPKVLFRLFNTPITVSDRENANKRLRMMNIPSLNLAIQGLGHNKDNLNPNTYHVGSSSSSSSNQQNNKGKAPAVVPEDEPKYIENIAEFLGATKTRSYLFQGHENENVARNFIDPQFINPTERNVQNNALPAPAPALRLDTNSCCLFCHRNLAYDLNPIQRKVCGHYYHVNCYNAQPPPIKEWHMRSPTCNFCTLLR